MNISISTLVYKLIIDPVHSRLRGAIKENILPGARETDVACGTGALSIEMAKKAGHVTGIDISDQMINAAKRSALKSRTGNVSFEICDASDLSRYQEHHFDIAIISMAVHQYDAALAIKILAGMKKIAADVIIADYNHRMPNGFGRVVAWNTERRNFQVNNLLQPEAVKSDKFSACCENAGNKTGSNKNKTLKIGLVSV